MVPDPRATLDAIETRLEALATAEENDVFDLYYKHADVDVGVHERIRRDALLAPEAAACCDAVKAGGYDALTVRRAELLSSWVNEARAQTDEIIQLKEEIQNICLATKPVFDGRDIPRHEKTEILFKDGDRDRRRRALFSESKLRAELAERGRRLYRLRNAAARALGYDDYPSLALAGEDLTVAELETVFDRHERATRGPYEELMAEGRARFGLATLEPWDINYVTEKLCGAPDEYFPRAGARPSLTAVVRAFGRDLDAMGIAIRDDADIPYGGLCFAVHIPDDVRILINLKDGLGNYRVFYHEFGHAVHRKFVTTPHFILKVGDPGFYAEAMAEIWGMFVGREAWLKEFTAMSAGDRARIRAAEEREYAVRVRRFMASQMFEIDAYRDADGDLDARLDAHAERFLGVRYADAGMWSEVYFPFLYPMYNKNYMLARVIQRAVHGHLEKRFGEPLGEPRAFDFLMEHFYADGAAIPWKEKLAAVGASLLPPPA